jgi:RNA polymerase sigma-70 factor (ECF subfamily)
VEALTREQHRGWQGSDAPAANGVLGRAEFQLAVKEHGPAVHRYLSARLGPEHAEEALSEAFATAWKIRASFKQRRGETPEAWLLGVATNVIRQHRDRERRWLRMCRDSARDQASRSDAVDELLEVDARVDAARRLESIASVVASLPRRERDPLMLHATQDLTYEQIAEILEIPIGTVRSRISRAKARLTKAMADTGVQHVR